MNGLLILDNSILVMNFGYAAKTKSSKYPIAAHQTHAGGSEIGKKANKAAIFFRVLQLS